MADEKRKSFGVIEDGLLERVPLDESLEGAGEVPAISNEARSTRKVMVALLALGVSVPSDAGADSFVGASEGLGNTYVVSDTQSYSGDVTVEPDMYNAPVPSGAIVSELERIDGSRFVRGFYIQDGISKTQILEFDGESFIVTGELNTIGHYEILPNGDVQIVNTLGLYVFDPDDPQGTFEQVVESNPAEYFRTAASFTDSNGDRCHLIAGQENVIRLVAETPEGVTETFIPIPPDIYAFGISDLRIGDGQLLINNVGRLYAVPFDPNNPTALIDDIQQNATLVHTATEDNINDAVLGPGYIVVGEGDRVMIYSEGNSARDDLEIFGQRGFEQSGGNLYVSAFRSVAIIDPITKEIKSTIHFPNVEGGPNVDGGLAVIPDTIPPDIQAQFDANPAINGIEWAVSPGVPQPTAGDGPSTLDVTIPDEALLDEDVYVYFMGPVPTPGGPSPYEVVTLHFSSHDIALVGQGTAGGLHLDQQSGDLSQGVTGELEIFEDGRLEAQPSRIVMEEYEVVEGENGPEERVVAVIDLGTFGEVTGRSDETGDDDDDSIGSANDDDASVTPPGGCEGCHVSVVKQPGGAWLIQFALAGVALAAGRRRRIRIEQA